MLLNMKASIALPGRLMENILLIIRIETDQINQMTTHKAMDVDASWSPDGQNILFASNRNGNWDIHLYSLKTKEITPFIQHEAKDISPKWSPDGKSVLFLSDRNGSQQLHLMELSSKKIEQLTSTQSNISHPSWSSDGMFIQFDQYHKSPDQKSGRSSIYQMNMVNKKIKKLYDSKGSSIAAQLVKGSLYLTNNSKGNWDIIKVDLTTGNEFALTNTQTNEMKASVNNSESNIVYSAANKKGVFSVKIESLLR